MRQIHSEGGLGLGHGRNSELPSIPLSSVSVSAAEVSAVTKAVKRGDVSGTGPDVAAFERCLEGHTDCKYAIATNSGTSALDLALEAFNFAPRDEVIVPAFTFAAPASAVVNAGLTPVICDVDPASWTLAVDACAALVSRRTRAIIAVDVMGNPCQYDALGALGLPIIEDAAESFGGSYAGIPLGALGTIGIFSFHANKTVSVGEGGALLTDDGDLAAVARLRANHGMRPGYLHEIAGRNLRMANLVAAFGVAQLERTPELVAKRQAVITAYEAAFEVLPLQRQTVQPSATKAPWLAVFRVSNRDGLLAHLRNLRIDARAVWPSLTRQPFLATWPSSAPVAEALARQCIWLPTFADMTETQVQRVVDGVSSYYKGRRG